MFGKEPNKIFNNPKDRSPKILDEEHLLESANDSARHFRNVYAAYLIIMLYIFVVILSVDHELLFRAGDKQLPLINISVPIVEFFTYMPLALLVVHFYLLVQAAFLSEKVSLYRLRLDDHLIPKDIKKAQRLLSSLPLAHILVDKGFQGKQPFMLYAIVFISLVIFPLGVLITAQIQFLPYQDVVITWVHHRVVVMIDIGLLWYFYFRIFVNEGKWWGWFKGKGKFIFKFLTILIVVSIIMLVAFPNKGFVWFTDLGIISNHFNLPNYKLVKREPAPEILAAYINKEEDVKKSIELVSSIWCEYAEPLDLKGRDFIEAELRDTILCDADLRDADLTGANLTGAKLPDAYLFGTNLTGAYLYKADLTSADLRSAILTSADLEGADLTGAYLIGADLTGAYLIGANLRKADLEEANLTSADLKGADLEGANLISANLGDADLGGANLTSVDLREADLTFADLREADLTSADLTFANLREADLTFANLREADLTSADLRKADLTSAFLGSANLTSADLTKTNLTAANLSETDFSGATISEETVLDYTWVWEGYLPRGIPKDWDTTLKPEYICPLDFSISKHINVSEYSRWEQEELKNALRQIIEEKCEPYTNASE